MKFRVSLLVLTLTASSAAHAMNDAELTTVVDERLASMASAGSAW